MFSILILLQWANCTFYVFFFKLIWSLKVRIFGLILVLQCLEFGGRYLHWIRWHGAALKSPAWLKLFEFHVRMFNPSMDSARTGASVARTVVPMRFVWPYGGSNVYLSGSFTRCVFFAAHFPLLKVIIWFRFLFCFGGIYVIFAWLFFSWIFFQRWSELVHMSPVEGCPTVFQVIYNLTPGYHQVSL